MKKVSKLRLDGQSGVTCSYTYAFPALIPFSFRLFSNCANELFVDYLDTNFYIGCAGQKIPRFHIY